MSTQNTPKQDNLNINKELTPTQADSPQNGIIKQTKRKLAQVTTAVALGGVLSGTPALSQDKPIYKQLASNEVMLVAENIISAEQFFVDAQLNENRRETFNSLGEETKRTVLKYYSEGLNDSPGIDSKGRKILGGALVDYYESLLNTKEYIKERKVGNNSYMFKGGSSLDYEGKRMEKYLIRYGNSFSTTGLQIDEIALKLSQENIRRLDEKSKKLDEKSKKLDEKSKKLDELSKKLDELSKLLDKLL